LRQTIPDTVSLKKRNVPAEKYLALRETPKAQKNESIASAESAEAFSKKMPVSRRVRLKPSEKCSEQKEYNRRNIENSDDDCLGVPWRLVDEGEAVHHLKKERRQHSGGTAAG
jgi:hypothetical protein